MVLGWGRQGVSLSERGNLEHCIGALDSGGVRLEYKAPGLGWHVYIGSGKREDMVEPDM